MKIANRCVVAVLGSRLHGLLSASTCVVRYRGWRSGQQFETPTQFAECGDELVILVADPTSKSWWRNFADARPLDVLVRGTWRPMAGKVSVVERAAELPPAIQAYVAKFPRSVSLVAAGATFVVCRPQSGRMAS